MILSGLEIKKHLGKEINGVEICQIYYHSLQGEYQKYDSGKYQNNTGIQPSLLYRDFEKGAK